MSDHRTTSGEGGSKDLPETISGFLEKIRGLEAINAELEAELDKHRWVPVGEITEDQSDRPVLVFHPDWGWAIGSYYQDEWHSGFLVRVDPTHFMPIAPPLPTTPKVDGGGE